MNINISTIPIKEIFDLKCGCPICTINKNLENRLITFIVGDAMMEPDIRVQTNKIGFCCEHLTMMRDKQQRLPVTLTLETHLREIDEKILNAGLSDKKIVNELTKLSHRCFICSNLEESLNSALNTVVNMYIKDKNFTELFRAQEFLCLPHYTSLLVQAQKHLLKKNYNLLSNDCKVLVRNKISSLRKDAGVFIDAFDYRTEDKNMSENAKKSIERITEFLLAKPE